MLSPYCGHCTPSPQCPFLYSTTELCHLTRLKHKIQIYCYSKWIWKQCQDLIKRHVPVTMYCESALKAASQTHLWPSCLSSVCSVKSLVRHTLADWSADVVTSSLREKEKIQPKLPRCHVVEIMPKEVKAHDLRRIWTKCAFKCKLRVGFNLVTWV